EQRRAERTAAVIHGSNGDVEISRDIGPPLAVATEQDRWLRGGAASLLPPPGWEGGVGARVPEGLAEAGADVPLAQSGELTPNGPGGVTAADAGTVPELPAVTAESGVGAVPRSGGAEGNSARWEAVVAAVRGGGGAEREGGLVRGSASGRAVVRWRVCCTTW